MTEPNAGSDLAAMKTTATEDGDHIVLNGQKTFISNGINCDLVVVAARDPSINDPHSAVDLFLVDATTPGFEKGKQIKKIGWHSQDTAEMYFTDCRIPKENRMGEKGTGFLKLMQKLQQERLVCAIGAVASAELMVAMTIQYCKERTAFGKPLSKFQHTQFELVEMSTEAKVGRTFLDKLIMDHVEGKNVVVEVSMAKFWTTDMAFKVADRCLQLYGGYGYCDEYPISRYWRDIRVTRIFAGTNEIMKMIAARFMGL
jgi:acyl-CoA dehydrogenase